MPMYLAKALRRFHPQEGKAVIEADSLTAAKAICDDEGMKFVWTKTQVVGLEITSVLPTSMLSSPPAWGVSDVLEGFTLESWTDAGDFLNALVKFLESGWSMDITRERDGKYRVIATVRGIILQSSGLILIEVMKDIALVHRSLNIPLMRDGATLSVNVSLDKPDEAS